VVKRNNITKVQHKIKTSKINDAKNYYDILMEDEVIENDNRVVLPMASNIKLEEWIENERRTTQEISESYEIEKITV